MLRPALAGLALLLAAALPTAASVKAELMAFPGYALFIRRTATD
jgi:hypothetical protein